ncbi:Molybdenum cofactor guanylyltransferase [Agromyces sp. NDB4Y10]|uniref:molybdenum cofactor guanylyltransferase n=1 Tax=Agromyces sp. NDB4Y10 TaxID=1775951 RepID=UPI0007B1F9CE|nr:NTP transferase domain-containing protein [Agromyces sp. NDB4Y10]KZE92753.1 Molybdenum cofactor guanylyltransferase [Agromyces sp. NDB4Y10]
MSGVDAVILAGGRAARLGGVSKPDLMVDGRRLLTTAVDAARAAGCERIVVVGPAELAAPGCLRAREEPPFGGPVAALSAGLAALGPVSGADVLVLACDMPDVGAAVTRLAAARGAYPDRDGVALVDASGRTQWLAMRCARAALERALDAIAPDGDRAALHGAPMRRLAASVDLATVADGGSTHDIDTWGDLARATGPEGAP